MTTAQKTEYLQDRKLPAIPKEDTKGLRIDDRNGEQEHWRVKMGGRNRGVHNSRKLPQHRVQGRPQANGMSEWLAKRPTNRALPLESSQSKNMKKIRDCSWLQGNRFRNAREPRPHGMLHTSKQWKAHDGRDTIGTSAAFKWMYRWPSERKKVRKERGENVNCTA